MDGEPNHEQLIVAHLPMVRAIARQVGASLPRSIEQQDLEGTGFLALVQAVRSYRPDHPSAVPVKIWIKFKVRGAIIDSVKGRDYRWELHAPLVSDSRPDTSPPPLEGILHKEQASLLARAMRVLPRRERAILRHTQAGWRLIDMGKRLGLTQAAVWQIRQRAIAHVRAHLEDSIWQNRVRKRSG